MFEENYKFIIITFIIGLFLGISTMAYAAYADSPWGYYGPHLGYSYRNQASVSDGPFLNAQTEVRVQYDFFVPTGYMGAQGRLFKGDVALKTSIMKYNSGTAGGIIWGTDNGTFPAGAYYSKGVSAAYNGNGYNNYYTFQSPSINY